MNSRKITLMAIVLLLAVGAAQATSNVRVTIAVDILKIFLRNMLVSRLFF